MENRKPDALVERNSDAIVKLDAHECVVAPVADIFETKDAFVLKLDMPGAIKENIGLHIEPNRLSIQSSIVSHQKENTKLFFSEIGRKRYFREFNIGSGIDYEKINAQFEDGVLTITLPKAEEAKVREIQIH